MFVKSYWEETLTFPAVTHFKPELKMNALNLINTNAALALFKC